ncbi:lipocalin family protein [Variovorax sp. PCZ-1]|uniref:lipocalin family protein n=1 Tax=Variovorax sp. PCZ-1 TaxID=2835533 RepID=UPI001BCE9561|nr:lipocalin family protein [Variovorax sp. PCZ-1]MBS7808720.1 lipocalin family protein [Variovorax sp. PCZ-1]
MTSIFRNALRLAVGLVAASAFAQSTPPTAVLTTVPSIELARYQGVWHQVALYPNRFQKMCASNTRATYAVEEGGTVSVTNQCRSADGKEVQAVGQARPAGAARVSNGQITPPQLQVRFAPAWLSWLPFVWGNYWVIQLEPNYRYAVVGEPSREFLWVLARETQLSATDWSAIEARLKEQGYDPAKLVREKHTP